MFPLLGLSTMRGMGQGLKVKMTTAENDLQRVMWDFCVASELGSIQMITQLQTTLTDSRGPGQPTT